jgi:hypothetical protein
LRFKYKIFLSYLDKYSRHFQGSSCSRDTLGPLEGGTSPVMLRAIRGPGRCTGRPRALSCDVTLEETVGRALRHIADHWERDKHKVGVGVPCTTWRTIWNVIHKRWGLGVPCTTWRTIWSVTNKRWVLGVPCATWRTIWIRTNTRWGLGDGHMKWGIH